VDWQRLARANTHPLRISIVEVLSIDGGRVLSPSDLSCELSAPLSKVNYHVTELAKSGIIDLVGERPVRGATEHFYRLAVGETTARSAASSNGKVIRLPEGARIVRRASSRAQRRRAR
jgi:DNA-binding transcriptional ArsR family regulator